MKFIYLITGLLFTSPCLGSKEASPLTRKVSLSPDGKYLKIPAYIKELLTAQTLDEAKLPELTAFLSENNGGLSTKESIDTKGISLLVHAVESKHEPIRKEVYNAQPDFNRLCNGRSALFHAVASSNLQSVQVMRELIENKADIKTTWENITLEDQIDSVLQAQYANLASCNSSPQHRSSHMNENKELKERTLRLIELFTAKKNLLAHERAKLEEQAAQANATK